MDSSNKSDVSDVDRKEIIWWVVSQVAPGSTVSYGEVARRAGLPGLARYVGHALAQLPDDSGVPWHRVINAQRRISFAPHSRQHEEQVRRLTSEGVTISSGRVLTPFFQG